MNTKPPDNLRQKHVAVFANHVSEFERYCLEKEQIKDDGYVYHINRKCFETPGRYYQFFNPIFPDRYVGGRFERIVLVNINNKPAENELRSRLEDPVFGRITKVEMEK